MNLIVRLFEGVSLINAASGPIVVEDGVSHRLLVTILHCRLLHGVAGAIAVCLALQGPTIKSVKRHLLHLNLLLIELIALVVAIAIASLSHFDYKIQT